MALGVGPGDEVITHAVLVLRHGRRDRAARRDAGVRRHRAGDVQPRPPAAVAAAITPRTKAIMPVHLFGQCADMEPIAERRAAASPVIEDAAQAIGAATRHGRPAVGALAASRSSRPRTSARSATPGCVTTDDDALARRRAAAAHARRRPKYYHQLVGGNFRIDALQAAVLRVKLPHLDALDRRRAARNAARYRELFAASTGRAGRVDAAGRAADRGHIYNQFVDPRARIATRCARTSTTAGSAPRSTTRCRSTCSRASRTSATGAGAFPTAERAAARGARAADLPRADRGAAAATSSIAIAAFYASAA